MSNEEEEAKRKPSDKPKAKPKLDRVQVESERQRLKNFTDRVSRVIRDTRRRQK